MCGGQTRQFRDHVEEGKLSLNWDTCGPAKRAMNQIKMFHTVCEATFIPSKIGMLLYHHVFMSSVFCFQHYD